MNECNGSGGSGACDLFQMQDDAAQKACRKKGRSPDLGNNEDVYGPISKMPGCNAITTTTEAALAQARAPCSEKDAPPAVLRRMRRNGTQIY